jgi:hypothetical protein
LIVQKLARIFFQMKPLEIYFDRLPVPLDIDAPADPERMRELRDLIAFRQIGIKIILPVEFHKLRRPAAEREDRAQAQREHFRVQHGQSARKTEADRADVLVGRRTEFDRAGAEYLRLGVELDMDFEAYCWDHRFTPCSKA